ncbi:MAG TPA: hypothetical protein VEC15_08220 [Actinomycetota bacterium]|nr:hypothetical protein [Actinomycetota bacterium]
MVERPSVLIVGVGVFGRLLAAELLRRTNADLVLAARRPPDAFAGELGEPDRVSTATVDLSHPRSLAVAARDRVAVACTAGPFQGFPADLPLAAVRAGAHWVDISDDRDWIISHLRDEDLDRAAHAGEVAVMPGLSTVPSLSGALARMTRNRLPTATRSRVTLCIGNRNAKGPGAIRSAFDGGLRDPIAVVLPPPFGRRAAYLGHSADEDLLREDLGLVAEFRVALEWRAAGVLMSGLGPIWSRLDTGRRSALGRALSAASRPFGWFGTSAGCLLVEVWDDGGRVVGVAALGDQRIAIAPCAIALERILSRELGTAGVVHPVRWLSPTTWLEEFGRRGIRVLERSPAGT